MSDELAASYGTEPGVDLPVDFEAYYLVHHTRYRRFAAEMLGDERFADEVVHEVFVIIAADWPQLLRQPDLHEAAWGVLAGAVMSELHRTQRLDEFARRVGSARATLAEMREALSRMDGGVGFYTELAELPQRQCEVVILRQIMGYTAEYSARILNIHARTVDYHHRRALESLRKALESRHILKPGHESARHIRKGGLR